MLSDRAAPNKRLQLINSKLDLDAAPGRLRTDAPAKVVLTLRVATPNVAVE